jgi:hypothetical protein
MHWYHCVPIQGKIIHRISEASAPSRIGQCRPVEAVFLPLRLHATQLKQRRATFLSGTHPTVFHTPVTLVAFGQVPVSGNSP